MIKSEKEKPHKAGTLVMSGWCYGTLDAKKHLMVVGIASKDRDYGSGYKQAAECLECDKAHHDAVDSAWFRDKADPAQCQLARRNIEKRIAARGESLRGSDEARARQMGEMNRRKDRT